MTVKYKAFTDVKELDKAIDSTIRKAQTLQAEVQIVAIGILQHAHKHGDYTRAERLVLGVGDGIRGKALVDWFVQYGGLLVGEDAEIGKGFIGWQGKEYIEAHFDDAKAKMWWTCKPESPFSGFDISDEVEKLIKRGEKNMRLAEKMRQEGRAEEASSIVVSADVLDALRKLSAA